MNASDTSLTPSSLNTLGVVYHRDPHPRNTVFVPFRNIRRLFIFDTFIFDAIGKVNYGSLPKFLDHFGFAYSL